MSVHGQNSLGGLGLVLEINGTILVAQATEVNATFTKWTRLFDRMGGSRDRTWTSYLVFSTRSQQTWRAILKWTRKTFAPYFNPVSSIEDYSQLGGMGAYSCANVVDGLVDSPLSPTILWDAHFWWPYQGMFFPPTKSVGEQWTSNNGSGEENRCGSLPNSFRHGQSVSDALVQKEYMTAKKANMTMLSYFNFNFFGQDIVLPKELNVTTKKRNSTMQQSSIDTTWKNSSNFLLAHFSHSFFPGPIYDWQRSIEMDPNDLTWASWLISQANATRNRLGDAFRGFVVDEPHLSEFSMNKDDSSSWCGCSCSATLWGWIGISQRIRNIFDEPSQHVMFSNQINTFRIDSLLYFDGIFTETNSDERFTHAASVTTVGLLTIGRLPGIVWTNTDDDVTSDVFHQQHLLFGVQPMAPYLGNDHAVQPGNLTFAAYLKYQLLYELMKGSQWWLNGDVTVVAKIPAPFVTNVFEGVTVKKRTFVVIVKQITSEIQDQSVSIQVNGWPQWVNASTCFLNDIGAGKNIALVPTDSGVFPPAFLTKNMLFVHCTEKKSQTIVVNVTEKVINSIDNSFLSFTLDTAFFCEANSVVAFLNNVNVKQLSSLLMPFSIRVGGTQSDYSQADFGINAPELPGVRQKGWGCNYTLNQFKQLMNFSISLGNAEIIFGLNSLTREGGQQMGKWNGINAQSILGATESSTISGWELGNEPELWWLQSFANNISAKEHAEDFSTLRQLLPHKQSSVIGPDFFVQCLPQFPSCDTKYLQMFLAEKPLIDVLTFHLYPWLGTVDQPVTPTANSMYNISILNVAGIATKNIIACISEAGMKIPVWMGEGSPDWKREQDGSALGHNFTFEFAWLDMLGQFAENGAQRVYRQSFRSLVGGADTSKIPPAYFMSLLWKILITKHPAINVYYVEIKDSEGNRNEVIRSYALGDNIILLNTDQENVMDVNLESFKCQNTRKEWHCVGGPDVGKIHGLLVNGIQPRWNIYQNNVDFGKPMQNKCTSIVKVEPGGVVFVEM